MADNKKLAKVIRIATLPPIMATLLILILWNDYPPYHAPAALFALVILPMLSYLVWRLVPSLYSKGRDSQRKLAVIFSVIGYIGGLLFCVFCNGSTEELYIYLCYVFSGVMIAISSVLGFKSSGHAAGSAGPVAVLVLCKSPWYIFGVVILALVFYSSRVLKRHTVQELILGSAYPVLAAIVLKFILW